MVEEIKKMKRVPREMSSTPVLSNGRPDNALDIVKEALDMIHKEDEGRPQIIRQFDDMLARERLSKMIKDDGLY